MLLKLRAERHSTCKRGRGGAPHMEGWNSCLESCQHCPQPAAPGLPVLLSLPQVDEWLLWGCHHWRVRPAALGPEADSAGNSWRPRDWRQGWKEGCSEGWVRGWYTLSLQGFQLLRKEEDDWEEGRKATLLSGKGWRRTGLFAKSGGRLKGLPLRQNK